MEKEFNDPFLQRSDPVELGLLVFLKQSAPSFDSRQPG